ncbi:hypothetical protein RI129_008411 [Pyrocoelia pectoralis]|uniref:Uncharacterized protein n=1 Tax=Pyrocoelia pectoralis TaxID=417401 RepID=A0AAN7VF74_9COLE
MLPIKLHMIDGSPPVRAVLVIANALNIPLEKNYVDVINGEQFKPEYLKINPLHTVPCLDDNGNIICDSHAIVTYLANKYAKDDSLYPTDAYKRALVDQKLAFDLGTLVPLVKLINVSYKMKEITALTSKMIEKINEVYTLCDTMLNGKKWLALDHLTLADVSCYTTTTGLNYHLPINAVTYPNFKAWFDRCRNHPLLASDIYQLNKYIEYIKSFST